MKNKIISVILAICMFVSLLSPMVSVMAENTDVEQNGYFDEEAEFELTAPEIAVNETLDEISSDEELISQEDIEEYVSQAEEIIRQVEDTSAESSISRFRRSINAVDLEGDGTEDSPYLIKSKDDLQYLADYTNNGYSFSGEYISLQDDIDLSEAAFMRIGTQSYSFKGVFQGNDKKISNITISEGSSGHQGLFGYINGAKIENTVLENANVEGYTYSGTLVGRALNSVISGCMANGTVTSYGFVGGLVGSVGSDTEISNCKFVGTVIDKSDKNSNGNAGGITGVTSNSIVNSCSVIVDVSSASSYIGGVVGLK